MNTNEGYPSFGTNYDRFVKQNDMQYKEYQQLGDWIPKPEKEYYREIEINRQAIEENLGVPPDVVTKTYGPSWAYFAVSKGYFWFRLFGYGLHFKNWKKCGLIFSERYFWLPKKRVLIVGYVIVKVLRPVK